MRSENKIMARLLYADALRGQSGKIHFRKKKFVSQTIIKNSFHIYFSFFIYLYFAENVQIPPIKKIKYAKKLEIR